jgi:hypothetical protein
LFASLLALAAHGTLADAQQTAPQNHISSPTVELESPNGGGTLYRFVDKEAGVACYEQSYSRALSCVPAPQIFLMRQAQSR